MTCLAMFSGSSALRSFAKVGGVTPPSNHLLALSCHATCPSSLSNPYLTSSPCQGTGVARQWIVYPSGNARLPIRDELLGDHWLGEALPSIKYLLSVMNASKLKWET